MASPSTSTSSSSSPSVSIADALQLAASSQTCRKVAELWASMCELYFEQQNGYQIVIEEDEEANARVVVYETEAFDEALIEPNPTGKLVASPDGETMVYQDEEEAAPSKSHATRKGAQSARKDSLTSALSESDITLEQYVNAPTPALTYRKVPIFVIECRPANTESYTEFRTPQATDMSRSFGPVNESSIQASLLKYCNHISVNVGEKYQDQVLCATAIGTQVIFWKKVRQVPQLRPWSDLLDLRDGKDMAAAVNRFVDVLNNGFEFAMEFAGLNIERQYDGLD
ncbi:hypothetical protein EJ08DRAFT_662951 [Tothia fuscella]|uniref:Uncharacterized protein n=1 Tax=Tothia fuscella TaxID=1048955 RepID=A0A9P4NLR5_9PEZI|nr:hypothetical protein EJ08DRAFT_662951 [Tothia fuscella]